MADGLRAVASDGDDRVDAQLLRIGDDLIGNVGHDLPLVFFLFVLERIAAIGGAENRSPARQNSTHLVQREFKRFLRPDETVEAIGNADDFPVVFEDSRLSSGANYGVEAGSVPASCSNANTANFRH